VLAPLGPWLSAPCIDVHDLATWMLQAVEQGLQGDLNATGPQGLTLGEVLDTGRRVLHGEATVTWVSEAFLEQHGVGAWIELPLWIPGSDAALRGMLQIGCSKAIAHGLRYRPIADTLFSTYRWTRTAAGQTSMSRQVQPERERALLAAWHALHRPGVAPPN
jgi:2'-hydroxyisoflavone reductase